MSRPRTQASPPDLKPRRHGPRYRKVEVALWGDGRFASLTAAPPNAQTLWLYLLCGWRTTIFPGLVIARPAVLASDLKWPLGGFGEASPPGLLEALYEVRDQNLITIDETAGVILLRKALFHGPGRTREDVRETARPESPNVIIGWSKSWFDVPDCQLKTEYLHELGDFCEALGGGFPQAYRVGFRKALAKASTKGTPHPSSNQDQDQDSGTGTGNEEKEREEDLVPHFVDSVRDDDANPLRSAALRVLVKLTERNGVVYTSPEHARLVMDRLREGRTEHELRAVIAYCAADLRWADSDKMRGQLSPQTLFGSRAKLSTYLDPARTLYADLIAGAA